MQNSVYVDFKLCLGRKPIEFTEDIGWRIAFGIHWLFEMLTDPWYSL